MGSHDVWEREVGLAGSGSGSGSWRRETRAKTEHCSKSSSRAITVTDSQSSLG